MADLLPPTPVGVPPGHSFWNDWYERLRVLVNTGSINVLWSNINFAGSTLNSIASREHNVLQSTQGGSAGEKYHLSSAQHTEATAARSSRGIDTTDDLIIDDATQGLVLKDTQGTPHYWRVTVDNTGVLVISDLGTTKP